MDLALMIAPGLPCYHRCMCVRSIIAAGLLLCLVMGCRGRSKLETHDEPPPAAEGPLQEAVSTPATDAGTQSDPSASRGGGPDAPGAAGSGETGSRSMFSPVKIGMPSVKGGHPVEGIRKALIQRRNHLRYCHEKGLVDDPRLQGDVEFEFTISAEGNVTQAKIADSTLESEGVEKCLLVKLKSSTFPSSQGGGIAVVNVTVTFRIPK
jgi:hypothetical protein